MKLSDVSGEKFPKTNLVDAPRAELKSSHLIHNVKRLKIQLHKLDLNSLSTHLVTNKSFLNFFCLFNKFFKFKFIFNSKR